MFAPIQVGKHSLPYLIAIAIGAVIYLLFSELGLAFASINDSVSPVWPAAGLAVVALVLLDRRLWPAIFLGAWLANIPLSGVVPAAAIGLGAALEGLIGAYIVGRFDRQRSEHFLPARSLGYVVASIVAPMASAVIGLVALRTGGLVATDDYIPVLLTWWAGDALGVLILAPALLSLAASHDDPAATTTAVVRLSNTGPSSNVPHLLGLTAALLLTFCLSGTGVAPAMLFVAFPVVLLTVRWFGAPGGAWITLLIATILLLQTAYGFGAFATQSLNDRLLDAQIFIAALAFCALVFTDLRNLDLRLAGWVFCAGCVLAALVFAISARIERELATERFGKVAEAAGSNIRQRLEIYADSLHAGGSFIAALPQMTRRDWRAYADSLDLIHRYPGINGIGVIVPVSPDNVDRFVATTRRDDAPDFTIRPIPGTSEPDHPGDDHLVVLYIEPMTTNSPVLGLDVSTEPDRRHTAVTARDLGQPRLSDPIPLVQDARKRLGFLLFVPAYQPGLPLQTVAQRQAAFHGWIYAPFIADTFFREALKDWDQQIEVEIFNGDNAAASPLYASAIPSEAEPAAQLNARDLPLEIFGHHFTMRTWPGKAFPLARQSASVSLGAGLALLATLFAALIANLQSLRERANAIAVQMTEALARSNERFSLAIAGSQDGIWDWNLEEGTIWTSARCRQMLGYAPEERFGPLESWRDFMHPDDLRLTIEATRALVRRDTPHLDIVQRYRHRDGNFVHVHNRALATYREDGRAIRIVGALTDITPLLRAEERLRTAIGVMDSGFALFDAEDRLVLFNEGFLDAGTKHVLSDPTGCTAEEIFSIFAYGDLTAVDALPDRAAWLKHRITLHRDPPEIPFEIAWTDGRWMRVFERRLSDGGTVSVWTDITLLKQAERRLQDAIESINEGFILLDKDLRIVMVNSHMADMYPLTAPAFAPGKMLEDALRYGAERGEYDAETPEEIEEFVRYWMAIFRSDEPFLGEGHFRNGQWALISHHRTSDGGYASLRADITAQKQREAELEQAKLQLEDRATQLTRLAEDLDRARRVADEANRGKSRFLANTSHELRTPLTAILGFSDVMSSEIFGRIEPPVYREYIDLIHESGEHLLSLINDILDLSKIEAGKMRLNFQAVATAELLRQSSSLMRVLATERGIDLIIDAAANCPVMHVDERAARQIILNLLSNAIKFTPGGGQVTLAVKATVSGFDISVTDTGIGMTADEADRALQLYVQVDSDVARMALGTGIGLPLVKALAELHGGTIAIDSQKHHGTTITVTLPWHAELSREALPSTAAVTTRDLLPLRGGDWAASSDAGKNVTLPENARRVLVVEDNEINQSLITVILNRMSLQVDCASDGLAGVEMAAAKHYDLVIMDVQMPRLDGIEATRRIRALAGGTGLIPIIALTADAEGAQRDRCLAAGMTEVLAKPIVPPLLVATVTRFLSTRTDAPVLITEQS